jgi:uncharacterized phage protein (TIGR02218 family)
VTDAIATQVGLEALTEEDAVAFVTQFGIEALTEEDAVAFVTQFGIEVLTLEPPPALVTQIGIEALVFERPCVTTMCFCWTILRRDGVVMAFTSHDRPVPFQGRSYSPCASMRMSATETAANANGNAQLVGLIDSDAISEADLLAGVYDQAAVEVWEIDWSGTTGETPHLESAYRIGDITVRDLDFEAQVETPSEQLSQTAALDVTSNQCAWSDITDPRCGVDVPTWTVTGTVTSVSDAGLFADTGRTEANHSFQWGTITWTSGANDGRQMTVKDSTQTGGLIELMRRMPFPIAVGDTYSMIHGCDKLLSSALGCTKFANIINFGGFDDIPGIDEIAQTPDAKA